MESVTLQTAPTASHTENDPAELNTFHILCLQSVKSCFVFSSRGSEHLTKHRRREVDMRVNERSKQIWSFVVRSPLYGAGLPMKGPKNWVVGKQKKPIPKRILYTWVLGENIGSFDVFEQLKSKAEEKLFKTTHKSKYQSKLRLNLH